MPKLETAADVSYQHQLPTVSYRVISDDPSLLAPAGVHSEQLKHYGYNDFSDFTRPEHYIRHIEPIESELAVQVEYDMDEQGMSHQAWLDSINAERKKEQSGPITYEVFEIIMDKLEKEWFNLVKRIPQPASHMPVEDSKCAVCDDGEGENSNAIVFCDGCNLAVHQDCYGVPYIPEGQWLCRKCTVSPENPVSCLICPNEGGAFKQTTTGHWAHLLCAIWIPELMVGNAIYMEPIDGVEAIPKNRWKLICSLCRERVGACIQCENRNCFTAFHVTCARQVGYLMSMKAIHNEGSLRAYCEKHLPDELRQDPLDNDLDSDYSGTPNPARKRRRKSHSGGQAVTTKTARAHAKSYRPGPPIVPHLIVQQLLDYVAKMSIRKRAGFVERLCRYWSLKREARRGAPMLKRLHLEPWTASNAGRQQTEAEKAMKLSFLRMLRNDLEKVRMLAEQVRKREREKLRQAQVIKDMVDDFMFPGYAQLRLTLEKISAMDRTELFLHPVNRMEVPDYFDVIKEPMSWMQMDDKLERNQYRSTTEFTRDVHLVLDNAMVYNKGETPFHKVAKRIKSKVQPLLAELDGMAARSVQQLPNQEFDLSMIPEGSIGDLEPSLLLLDSLLHPSTITADADNLAALFAFEMEKPRPPTPPPPSPPKKRQRHYPTAEEKKRKWEEREIARKERTAARATRAVASANSAFAQEAGLVPSDTEAHTRQASGEGGQRGTRRAGRSQLASTGLAADDATGSIVQAESGPSEPRGRIRNQRGVAGIETIAVLSDRQRREQERALDLVTDGVDEMDQFKRFNVGWVLPEGSKRRRAERPGTLSVPRGSSAKTNTASPLAAPAALPATKGLPPPSSPLTVASSESLTPPDSEADDDEPQGEIAVNAAPIVVSAGDGRSRRSHASASASGRKRRASNYPPAFGRSKKKKRPNRSSVGYQSKHEDEDIEMAQEEVREDEDEEHEEDTDDLSPVPDEEEEIVVVPDPHSTGEDGGAGIGRDAPTTFGEENEADPFPAGTLVWAKSAGFPYFPAVIVDYEDEEHGVPPGVLGLQPDETGPRHWLIQFYDATRSYAWVSEKRLDMLGETDSIDMMYLAGRERKHTRGFKSTREGMAVRKAYRDAKADMEDEAEEGQ